MIITSGGVGAALSSFHPWRGCKGSATSHRPILGYSLPPHLSRPPPFEYLIDQIRIALGWLPVAKVYKYEHLAASPSFCSLKAQPCSLRNLAASRVLFKGRVRPLSCRRRFFAAITVLRYWRLVGHGTAPSLSSGCM